MKDSFEKQDYMYKKGSVHSLLETFERIFDNLFPKNLYTLLHPGKSMSGGLLIVKWLMMLPEGGLFQQFNRSEFLYLTFIYLFFILLSSCYFYIFYSFFFLSIALSTSFSDASVCGNFNFFKGNCFKA